MGLVKQFNDRDSSMSLHTQVSSTGRSSYPIRTLTSWGHRQANHIALTGDFVYLIRVLAFYEPLVPCAYNDTRYIRRFAPRQRPGATFVTALLATAVFRCWHILLFYAAWSTLIAILNHQGHTLYFQPTLLTVCVVSLSRLRAPPLKFL